jgi:hypothetical protein
VPTEACWVRWMSGNPSGDSVIEAGLPHAWRVADKSGAAAYGTRNDIAVIRPRRRAPVVLAVFLRPGRVRLAVQGRAHRPDNSCGVPSAETLTCSREEHTQLLLAHPDP